MKEKKMFLPLVIICIIAVIIATVVFIHHINNPPEEESPPEKIHLQYNLQDRSPSDVKDIHDQYHQSKVINRSTDISTGDTTELIQLK